jgi:hypothetical protein
MLTEPNSKTAPPHSLASGAGDSHLDRVGAGRAVSGRSSALAALGTRDWSSRFHENGPHQHTKSSPG